MRLSAPAIVLSLCAVFATASPVPEDLVPRFQPPPGVTIDKISWAGSGCPAGSTVNVVPSPDWTIATLSFGEEFIAKVGPTYDYALKRRNCVVTFTLHYPQGFTIAVHQVDYYGRYDLQPNVKGYLQARYWFQGQGGGLVHPICTFPKPPKLVDNYYCVDGFLTGAVINSPCGASANLNVNVEVSLDNSAAPTHVGFLTVDAIEKKVRTVLHFQWKQC